MYSFPFQNTCIQTFVYMPVMISQSCSVLNYENNLKSDLTIQTSTYFKKKKKLILIWSQMIYGWILDQVCLYFGPFAW